MSWLDIVIILILVGAFFRGIQKGLAMQLTGFVAIIAGAIFAGKVANILLPHLMMMMDFSVNVVVVISYIVAFLLIALGIQFIGKMIDSLFVVLHLSFINKILGAALGVLSAAVVLSIFINLVIIIDDEKNIISDKLKSETLFYGHIQAIVPTIVPYLRSEIWNKYLPEQLDEINKEEKIKKYL